VLRQTGRSGNTLSATIREAWDTGTLRTLTKHDPVVAPCLPLRGLPADLARLLPQMCEIYGCPQAALACAARDERAARESFSAMAQELGLDKPPPKPERFLNATQYLRLGEPQELPKPESRQPQSGPTTATGNP
jgi:hypothetical protein